MAIGTTTALIIAAVVSAVGAGVGAYSSVQQGKAQEKAAEENARILEANARAAREKAEYDEEMHREKIKKLLKSQRAEYGAAGVDMEGTPMMVQADTMDQGELDALAIRRGGQAEFTHQMGLARLSRMQGKAALKSGYYQAGSTLLSSGSSIARSFA